MADVRKYDPQAVYVDDGAVGYLTACLKACTWAVDAIMNSASAKLVHGYDSIPVHPEAPAEGQSYPYLQIGYDNKKFEPLTMDELADVKMKDDLTAEVASYRFEGAFNIGVYSTSIAERERLSDCLIAQVGINRAFRLKLQENEWIDISPNMATLASPVANESWGVPWDDNLQTCYRNFAFQVHGEFYYKVTDTITYLTKVQVRSSIES